MNEAGLSRVVKDFAEVIRASDRLSTKGTHLSSVLGRFFAMWCAFRIRRNIEACEGNDINEPIESVVNDSQSEGCWALPKPDVVEDAGVRLMAATSSQDYDGAAGALAEMGVTALCPRLSEQFVRMESVARSVAGRAQLVPLVELSLFAVDVGEFERAAKYVVEAHSFAPAAYELYCLCVVEGLLAMNAGQERKAIQFLEQSIGACQRDEHASLACGVRGPNLALVEKLLDNGRRVEVLKHLLECKNVWQSFRPQIDAWISLIESGERPNFQESAMLSSMNEPACRLIMQYSRARALEEGNSLGLAAPQTSVPMSPTEVMARRERMQEAYRRSKERPTGN